MMVFKAMMMLVRCPGPTGLAGLDRSAKPLAWNISAYGQESVFFPWGMPQAGRHASKKIHGLGSSASQKKLDLVEYTQSSVHSSPSALGSAKATESILFAATSEDARNYSHGLPGPAMIMHGLFFTNHAPLLRLRPHFSHCCMPTSGMHATAEKARTVHNFHQRWRRDHREDQPQAPTTASQKTSGVQCGRCYPQGWRLSSQECASWWHGSQGAMILHRTVHEAICKRSG